MLSARDEQGPSGPDAVPLLVLPLHAVSTSQRSQVGGKAAALGALLSAGLPVPPGFCITTEAFRRFLATADAFPAVAALDSAPPDRLAQLSATLRAQLAAAAMPLALEQAILSAWRDSLRAGACAVRSSATAEDLYDASFAGQLDTILNVCDAEALLQAVRQCWVSLFSERAVAYRARRGLGHGGVHMAVLVQEFVPATAAGVLFTVNPLTGRADEVLIEGSLGLGEAVVSGRVTPDRFVVHKQTQRIAQRSVSNKTCAVVPAREGGVVDQEITAEAAQTPALSDENIQRLAQLGGAAERLFGAPQDVEWAVAGREVVVLQSRPITTPLRQNAADDHQVWTNMNTGEILPDVISPLTWSFLERSVVRCLVDLMAWLGFDLDHSPLFGRIAGRVYFNLNTLVAIGKVLPNAMNADVTALFGGSHSDAEVRRCMAIVEQNLPHVQLVRRRLLRRLPTIMAWAVRHHSTRGAERGLAALAFRVEERRRRDHSALSESSLIAELHACVDLFREAMTLLGSYVIVGLSYFSSLHAACTRWLPAEPNAANQLVTGVGGMASAAAGLDMWRLALYAHERPSVARALLAGEGFAGTRTALAEGDGGTQFLTRWDAFMEQHGHHARGEVELMNQRWAETPDYVLAQVRSYLAHIGGKDPVAAHGVQTGVAAERAAAFRAQLGNPAKRLAFDFLLRRARHGVVYRENLKSEGIRLIALARQTALALGRRLEARGVIERPDDVFYLDLAELSAQDGAPATDMRALVRRRRAEFEQHLSLTPPAVVVGELAPGDVESEVVDGGTDRLCGLGVSPGVVTGPARVISRADADERVLPGEILVAPFTDPGWTPTFSSPADC
jgi:rifampicin phosphotransferase